MKNLFKRTILLFLILCCSISYSSAQQSHSFEVKFSSQRNKVVLNGNMGCSWSMLAPRKKSYYLNQYGMVNLEANVNAYSNSAFIIEVKRKGDKVILEAVKGANWKQLSFRLSDNGFPVAVTINENGIIPNN